MKKKYFALPLMVVAVMGMIMSGCNNKKGLTDYSEYVTLGDYKGLVIEVDDATVTEEQVKGEYDAIIKHYTEKEKLTEGTVKEGDMINLDFTGYLDGKAFENGSTEGKGTDYTVGGVKDDKGNVTGKYIDDLDKQLVGLEVGKEYDLKCTFPKDYGKEELNGKEVVFKVKVNCIYGKDIVPELNDDLIKKLTDGDYTTLEAYDKYLREELYKYNLENQQTAYEYGMWSTIIKNCGRNGFPEDVLKTYFDGYYNDYKNYYTQMASLYGLDYTTYLVLYAGTTDAELQKYCQSLAEAELEYTMIAVEIAKVEGIDLTDEEIASQKAVIVESYSYADVAALEEQYKGFGENYFKESFLFDKVNEFLKEQNEMKVGEKSSTETSTEGATEGATQAPTEVTTEEKSTTGQ